MCRCPACGAVDLHLAQGDLVRTGLPASLGHQAGGTAAEGGIMDQKPNLPGRHRRERVLEYPGVGKKKLSTVVRVGGE